jgi:uncharacterized protein (TIGR03066 family)
MFQTRFALIALLIFGVVATLRGGPEDEKKRKGNREKLIGVWEFVNPKELPRGSTLEFTNDGKLKLTYQPDPEKERDKYTVIPGTYKVEKGMINVSMPGADGKDQKQTLKIIELTESTLVTKDEKGHDDEFKKLPDR